MVLIEVLKSLISRSVSPFVYALNVECYKRRSGCKVSVAFFEKCEGLTFEALPVDEDLSFLIGSLAVSFYLGDGWFVRFVKNDRKSLGDVEVFYALFEPSQQVKAMLIGKLARFYDERVNENLRSVLVELSVLGVDLSSLGVVGDSLGRVGGSVVDVLRFGSLLASLGFDYSFSVNGDDALLTF